MVMGLAGLSHGRGGLLQTSGHGDSPMKWMLIVMIFGTEPVKIDLIFDTVGGCLMTEQAMAAAYVGAFSPWTTWARATPSVSGFPGSQPFQQKRIGLENQGTCIAHAEPR
jgi:hypothetical protein